jgi:RimJ/RimL family protein N-acetyltransferase
MPGPAFRRGESVALCTVEEDDLPYLQRLHTDPDVRWTTTFASRPENDGTIEEWFEAEVSDPKNELTSFLVTHDDERVGYVELSGVERPASHGTLGCYVEPDVPEDVAVAALELGVGYAVEERRLHRVRATVLASDETARETLTHAGFTEEETRREEWYVDGTHRDVIGYAVLEDEWGEN